MTALRCCLATVVLASAGDGAAEELTTKPEPLDVARVTCSVVQNDQPLVVRPNEACACRSAPKSYVPTCITAGDELTRLVDHDTTINVVGYLRTLSQVIVKHHPLRDDVYLRFAWPGPDKDGKLAVRHLLWKRGEDALAKARLPGVHDAPGTALVSRRYVDVFVGFDPTASTPDSALPGLETLYTSIEKPHPLLEQIPAFVKQAGLLEALGAGLGTSSPRVPSLDEERSPTPHAVLKLYGPELPHKRADVTFRDWITTSPSAARLSAGAKELANTLSRGSGRQSTCAQLVAWELAAATDANSPCATEAGAVFSSPAIECRRKLNRALDDALQNVLTAQGKECSRDGGSMGADPVAAVNDAFRGYVGGLGASIVRGEGSLTNAPREGFSFGLMTAVRFGEPSFESTRAKVEEGKFREDPLPRLVTAVVLNWHPFGYDPDKLLTWRDRGSVKFSIGSAITPDFGLVGTLGYSPLKGLTINVGGAFLFVNAPKDGKTIGDDVTADLQNDPFEASKVGTWLWGLSYSFQ